jgi:MFS family permease
MFGMGAGIFFAGYVLFEIPGSLIAERYSMKLWIARIMVTWGIVSALMAFVTTAWEFYTVRFLLGVAEASLFPIAYGFGIARWFVHKDRARALAMLISCQVIAGILAGPLAGWLLGVSFMGLKGWQTMFVLEAVPAIVCAFIVPFWMADRPKDAKWLNEDEREYLTKQYEAEAALQQVKKRHTVWSAMTDREVLKLCLTYFLWITGYWGFNYWMPTVLKEVSGWSNMAVGWLSAVPMVGALIGMLYVGHSSSKTGERRWHGAVPLFIGAVGFCASVFVTTPWLSFCFVVIAAIGVYSPLGVWWSYPTSFLSGPAAAAAASLINSTGNSGGFVGPYITGFLKDYTGTFVSAWVYLAVSLTLAGFLILTFKRQPSDDIDK